MKCGFATLATSGQQASFQCSKEMVKSYLIEDWGFKRITSCILGSPSVSKESHLAFLVLPLLQAWKNGQPPMAQCMPRYRGTPNAEEIPASPSMPDFKICCLQDGRLIIPRDVRQAFLSDPVWGPEWRDVLKKFDADWGVAIPAATGSAPLTQPSAGSAPDPEQDHFWAGYFQDEPKTLEALKTKHGADMTEFAGPDASTSFFLAPGPALFIAAKEAVLIRCCDTPLLCHGAGTWLLGEKADKILRDNPGKAIPCKFTDDQAPVVIEDCPSRFFLMTPSKSSVFHLNIFFHNIFFPS